MLQLHLPRHQQDKQFQKYCRLVPHHLLYRLAAAATEGKMHLADGVGVKRMTRAMDVAGSVSKVADLRERGEASASRSWRQRNTPRVGGDQDHAGPQRRDDLDVDVPRFLPRRAAVKHP